MKREIGGLEARSREVDNREARDRVVDGEEGEAGHEVARRCRVHLCMFVRSIVESLLSPWASSVEIEIEIHRKSPLED